MIPEFSKQATFLMCLENFQHINSLLDSALYHFIWLRCYEAEVGAWRARAYPLSTTYGTAARSRSSEICRKRRGRQTRQPQIVCAARQRAAGTHPPGSVRPPVRRAAHRLSRQICIVSSAANLTTNIRHNASAQGTATCEPLPPRAPAAPASGGTTRHIHPPPHLQRSDLPTKFCA